MSLCRYFDINTQWNQRRSPISELKSERGRKKQNRNSWIDARPKDLPNWVAIRLKVRLNVLWLVSLSREGLILTFTLYAHGRHQLDEQTREKQPSYSASCLSGIKKKNIRCCILEKCKQRVPPDPPSELWNSQLAFVHKILSESSNPASLGNKLREGVETFSCLAAENCSEAADENEKCMCELGSLRVPTGCEWVFLEVLHWAPRGCASNFDLWDQSFTEKHKILTSLGLGQDHFWNLLLEWIRKGLETGFAISASWAPRGTSCVVQFNLEARNQRVCPSLLLSI